MEIVITDELFSEHHDIYVDGLKVCSIPEEPNTEQIQRMLELVCRALAVQIDCKIRKRLVSEAHGQR